jgi:hypothetical protein
MGEHYTKNTVSVTQFCKKCWWVTPHRVDNGRLGPCLTCIVKLGNQAEAKKEPAATQRGLWD